MEEADLKRHIADPLKAEYRAALAALRKSILAFPADEWCRGEKKVNEPARQAGHLLYGIERYLGGNKARVGKRFGVPLESFKANFAAADCPPAKDFLPWIDEAEQMAMNYIDQAVAKSLTGIRKEHPPLGLPTYFLRHTVVHLTLLRHELSERGIEKPGY